MNDADTAAWNVGAHTMLTQATLTGPAREVTDAVAQLAGRGVTEIVYQPAGDVRRELAAFAAVNALVAQA